MIQEQVHGSPPGTVRRSSKDSRCEYRARTRHRPARRSRRESERPAVGHLRRLHLRARRTQPPHPDEAGAGRTPDRARPRPGRDRGRRDVQRRALRLWCTALSAGSSNTSQRWALHACTAFCSIWASLRRSSNRLTAASASDATRRSTCAWIRPRDARRRSGSQRQRNPRSGRSSETYGEERFAKQIAAAIVAARARGALRTTRQLAALVAEAVPTREPRQDPATRTFQALRIHVNQELEELSLALPQCVELLEPEGGSS